MHVLSANPPRLLLLALIVCVFSAVWVVPDAALAGGEGWAKDMKAAMERATKEKKDLLLDFTGSDWCGWCIRLNKEVFSKEEFKKEAPKHFVLVELDFPRDTSKLSAETKKQNEEWKNKLGVRGFPTIFLADAKGRAYAQTGYQAGGAEKYLTHLGELRGVRAKRDKALEKAKKAKGVEKAKFLDEAMEAVGETLAISGYSAQVKEIIALDKDNAAGLKKKYQDRFNAGEVRKVISKVQQQYNRENLDEMMKLLEEAEKKYGAKGKAWVELASFKVNLLRSAGKMEDVLKLLDLLVKEKTVEAALRLQFRGLRGQVLGELGKVEEALQAFDELLKDDDAKQLKFRFHISKAEILLQADRKDDAAKEFDAAEAAAADERTKEQIRRYREQVFSKNS